MNRTNKRSGWNPADPEAREWERRAARRYNLALPLEVRPFEESDSSPPPTDTPNGRTRDISPKGVYFVADHEFTLGTEIALTLTLPAQYTRGTDVYICAQGKVVRAEKKYEDGVERAGMAAIIERYTIARQAPRRSEALVA